MENLTNQEVTDLLALTEAATPGVWHVGRHKDGFEEWAPLVHHEGLGAPICYFKRYGAPEMDRADAAYIAAANPTTLRRLLLELQQLRAATGAAGEAGGADLVALFAKIDAARFGITDVVSDLVHDYSGNLGDVVDEVMRQVVYPLYNALAALRAATPAAPAAAEAGGVLEALRENYESMQQTNQVLVNRLRACNSFMVNLANDLSAALDCGTDNEIESKFHEKTYQAWNRMHNALLDEMTGKGELVPPAPTAPPPPPAHQTPEQREEGGKES